MNVTKWNVEAVEAALTEIFSENSEMKLLSLLSQNTFLFYELYHRKAIQPVFKEVNFGAALRCDFAWLNDNSLGPEWVLVEVEKPRMKLFKKSGKPSAELNDAIDQVTSWSKYFAENPAEKRRIFGAVAKFRYVLVAGSASDWAEEKAARWRKHFNENQSIEIRSSDVFLKSMRMLKAVPTDFWSFEENPIALPSSSLTEFWSEYPYMDGWRKIF